MSGASAAVNLLGSVTDAAPVGVWSAPGRANLIGEHTDYNGGFVLPFAIQHRTFAAVAPRDDARIRVASTFAPEIVEVALDALDELFPARREEIVEWARYPLGVAWAVLQASARGVSGAGGLDLALASEVPIGAGLSSSAAVEGAVAGALNDLWSLGLDGVALAQAGRRAENEAVGAPTGIMDQVASMLGEQDAAVFLDCQSLQAELIPLGFEDADLALIVIDTLVKHSHATGGYRERRASCERAARDLGVASLREVSRAQLEAASLDDVTSRRAKHILSENERVLAAVEVLKSGDPLSLGPLLDASHTSMRDDFEISTPELDLAVETAREHGAVGARMTGGGFGGAAIALTPNALVGRVMAAVADAFASAGFTAPRIFTVTASHGASRDS